MAGALVRAVRSGAMGLVARQQPQHLGVAGLPGGHRPDQRQTLPVDESVALGRQATPGPAATVIAGLGPRNGQSHVVR